MSKSEHANQIADAKIAQWEGLKEFDADVRAELGGWYTPANAAARWADKEVQDTWLNADPAHESFYRDAMMIAEYKKYGPKKLWPRYGSAEHKLVLERVRAHWMDAGPGERRALLDAQIKANIDEAAEVLANATAHIVANRAKYVKRFEKQMDALVHSRVSSAELTWNNLALFGDDSEAD